MSNFTNVKIKCETPEIKDAFLSFFLHYKDQLAQYLALTLESKGLKSDTKVIVQGEEITLKQKSGSKGMVITSGGVDFKSEQYDELPEFASYMEVKGGGVMLYVKMPDNIDSLIGRFKDLDEAIANVKSNAIVEQRESAITEYKKSLEPTVVTETQEISNGETIE